MVRETGVQFQIKPYQRFKKMVLDVSLHYKVQTKGKWVNSEKRVVPSPKPLYSSYWKGSLPVALDYGRPTYLCTHCIKSINL